MRMKSAYFELMMAAAMMGGMSLGPTRGSNRNIPKAPEATAAQRSMFTQPKKLSRKQKAKRKSNKS